MHDSAPWPPAAGWTPPNLPGDKPGADDPPRPSPGGKPGAAAQL